MDEQKMLEFKTWAVVGATQDTSKYGYKLYKRLKNNDYNVYAITPKYDEIDGDKAFKELKDLPQKPDVVNFVVNPRIGINIVKQCVELGIKNIWLQPGTVSDEILEYANNNDINVVQACVLVSTNN